MRAFVAIELSESVRTVLSQLIEQLRRAERSAKWVEPQNLHLTLKFIGPLDKENVAPAVEILRDAARGIGPFTLDVCDVGGFPNLKRPRIVYAGTHDEQGAAREMAARLEEEMEALGIEREERDFRGHITLARRREPSPAPQLARILEAAMGQSYGSMTVSEITLMRSDLTPQGPIYTPVERVRLTG